MSQKNNGGRANGSGEFKCPECGRTFSRAAALGAHRQAAHGVAGAKAKRKLATRGAGRSRRAATTATSGATSTRESSQSTKQPARRAQAGSAARRAGSNGIDRDALLKIVFPSGIPARQEALRGVDAWLQEAERLSTIK